ncbi:MAG: ParB/RepB/Spo0J family partition protein [Clostridia bacterium]|nr:ParB/RepB/Spo0J family partition protein [Clostridia bacterium]
MAKKMGLGRGLSAILPDVEEVVESVDHQLPTTIVPTDAVVELNLGDIDPNRDQPRKKFDDEALSQLADSIRHSGVLSPILVARSGDRYTIIAGERRWRAARMAGIATIPAIVREWDEIKRQEAALIENIQRENLNPIEEAQGIYVLMNECALTQEEVSQRLGRSRPAVANLLRLLNLPAPIQHAVIDGVLSAGHARVLAGITDKKLQAALFAKTIQGGWSVRQLEAAAKQATQERKEKPQVMPLPVEYEELTERLRSATGLKVSLSGTENKGKIVLEYGSQEELQRLWDMLGE